MKNALVVAVGICLGSAMAAVGTDHISYTLEKAASPTADQLDAYARIEKVMDSALGYYNSLTTIRKSISVQYDASVPTADASSNGTLRFGSIRSYMYVGTAMHEIAHIVGVGTTSEYEALIVNGVFTGPHATAALRAITGTLPPSSKATRSTSGHTDSTTQARSSRRQILSTTAGSSKACTRICSTNP